MAEQLRAVVDRFTVEPAATQPVAHRSPGLPRPTRHDRSTTPSFGSYDHLAEV